MHGQQQWFAREGTILGVEAALGRHEHKYFVEARSWAGARVSGMIKHKDRVEYQVGTRVRVQVSDRGEIRFDPNYTGEAAVIATMDLSDRISAAAAEFAGGDAAESPLRETEGT